MQGVNATHLALSAEEGPRSAPSTCRVCSSSLLIQNLAGFCVRCAPSYAIPDSRENKRRRLEVAFNSLATHQSYVPSSTLHPTANANIVKKIQSVMPPTPIAHQRHASLSQLRKAPPSSAPPYPSYPNPYPQVQTLNSPPSHRIVSCPPYPLTNRHLREHNHLRTTQPPYRTHPEPDQGRVPPQTYPKPPPAMQYPRRIPSTMSQPVNGGAISPTKFASPYPPSFSSPPQQAEVSYPYPQPLSLPLKILSTQPTRPLSLPAFMKHPPVYTPQVPQQLLPEPALRLCPRYPCINVVPLNGSSKFCHPCQVASQQPTENTPSSLALYRVPGHPEHQVVRVPSNDAKNVITDSVPSPVSLKVEDEEDDDVILDTLQLVYPDHEEPTTPSSAPAPPVSEIRFEPQSSDVLVVEKSRTNTSGISAVSPPPRLPESTGSIAAVPEAPPELEPPLCVDPRELFLQIPIAAQGTSLGNKIGVCSNAGGGGDVRPMEILQRRGHATSEQEHPPLRQHVLAPRIHGWNPQQRAEQLLPRPLPQVLGWPPPLQTPQTTPEHSPPSLPSQHHPYLRKCVTEGCEGTLDLHMTTAAAMSGRCWTCLKLAWRARMGATVVPRRHPLPSPALTRIPSSLASGGSDKKKKRVTWADNVLGGEDEKNVMPEKGNQQHQKRSEPQGKQIDVPRGAQDSIKLETERHPLRLPTLKIKIRVPSKDKKEAPSPGCDTSRPASEYPLPSPASPALSSLSIPEGRSEGTPSISQQSGEPQLKSTFIPPTLATSGSSSPTRSSSPPQSGFVGWDSDLTDISDFTDLSTTEDSTNDNDIDTDTEDDNSSSVVDSPKVFNEPNLKIRIPPSSLHQTRDKGESGKLSSPSGHLSDSKKRICIVKSCNNEISPPYSDRPWEMCRQCQRGGAVDSPRKRSPPPDLYIVPPYTLYQSRSVLLDEYRAKLLGFLKAHSMDLKHRDHLQQQQGELKPRGTPENPAPDKQPVSTNFIFDGEFSVVALDFDIVKRKNAVHHQVLLFKDEIASIGQLDFAPVYSVTEMPRSGGIATRFKCRPGSREDYSSTMRGELELAVLPDYNHPMFPGQRTIVRFILVA